MTARAGAGWTGEAPELTDSVIRLRAWSADDAPFVFAACQDPEIQRWTRVPVPYTEADAAVFTDGFARAVWADRSGLALAVTDAGTGAPLGAVGVVAADHEHGVAELGYWIASELRRRGTARRALSLLRDWCGGPGGFHRIELPIERENVASQAVARRAGFRCEGILRGRMIHRGTRRDIALWAWCEGDGDGDADGDADTDRP
ncbi:MAG: GNAT family N-acetyltransferase [Actinomycetota bacterium]